MKCVFIYWCFCILSWSRPRAKVRLLSRESFRGRSSSWERKSVTWTLRSVGQRNSWLHKVSPLHAVRPGYLIRHYSFSSCCGQKTESQFTAFHSSTIIKVIPDTSVFSYLLTEQSISRTWAQVEDSRRRELLLQAFRQRCVLGRKVLSHDTQNISGHCQALEQMAR